MKITSKGLDISIEVPVGFKTDFATLPIVTQLVLGNRDQYVHAAIMHDWLCETHVPRFIANSLMRSLLLVVGCPYWKRLLFFKRLALMPL